MNRLSRTLLTSFFAGLVLIGAVRFLFPGLAGAVIAAILAVVIIGAAGWRYYRDNVRAEHAQTAGDNLYYLGLLFTLVSLILALIQLFVWDRSTAVDERAYELIGNFGVALFSTVAGILARIWMHSEFAEDRFEVHTGDEASGTAVVAAEQDEWAHRISTQDTRTLRDDLAELRRVLREATDAYSHFNRVTAMRSEETMAHTESTMRRFSEDMEIAVTKHLEQAATTLRTATDTLVSQSERLTRHFETVVTQFNNTIAAEAERGIGITSEAWQQAASAMREDGRKQMELFYGDINKLVSTTEGVWDRMTQLSEHVAAAGEVLKAQTSEFERTAQTGADANRSIALFVEQLEQAEKRLKATADAAGNASRRVADAVDGIKRIDIAIESDLKRIGDAALAGFEATTGEIRTRAREQLAKDSEEWYGEAKRARDEFERQKDAASSTLASAQQLNQQITSEASEWQRLAEQTRRSLVDAIDRLAETVGRR